MNICGLEPWENNYRDFCIHEYNPPEHQIYDTIKKNKSLPFLDVLECK
jgi:hypothetical protein